MRTVNQSLLLGGLALLAGVAAAGQGDDPRFSIGATSGVLSFASAPDFESPTDDDANNQYVVQITATAGGDSVAQTVTVTVNDADRDMR